jgi:hypothetical protein
MKEEEILLYTASDRPMIENTYAINVDVETL